MDDIREPRSNPRPPVKSRPGCRAGAAPRESCAGWRGALLLLPRPLPVRASSPASSRSASGRPAARPCVMVAPGADGRARADRHRRDQLHVGADVHVVLDHGAVLVGAVVVAGDGAGADVHVAARRWSRRRRRGGSPCCPRPSCARLHLDEVADVHLVVERGSPGGCAHRARCARWRRSSPPRSAQKGLISVPAPTVDVAQDAVGADLHAVAERRRGLRRCSSRRSRRRART